MEKVGFIAVFMLVLCLLTCLTCARPVIAQEAGYSHECYMAQTTITVDGKWTTSTEWTDALATTFGANAVFRDKWEYQSSTGNVYYDLLIETLDNTNDTGDFIEVCFDGNMTADSAPTFANDFAINFTGNAACTWYQGSATGWTQIATPASSVFQWNESFSSSPTYSTPHLIFEMRLWKNTNALGVGQIIGPEFWMLIETYDAHASGYGLQSWPLVPPSSPDVPKTYGDIPYSTSTYPESLNIGLVMVLSVVAVAAGSVLLRKRSKIANLASRTNATKP